MICNISCCMVIGMTILALLNRMPWWLVISSRKFQYGLAPGRALALSAGHPFSTVDVKSLRAGSSFVFSLISSNLGVVTGSV